MKVLDIACSCIRLLPKEARNAAAAASQPAAVTSY